jgi:hypothetical protein
LETQVAISASLPALQPVQILNPADLAAPGNTTLHDLIFFTSTALQPFAELELPGSDQRDGRLQLWGFSPDGLRLGELTDPQLDFAIYFPSRRGELLHLVEYGVHFNHPALKGVALPVECYGELPERERSLGTTLPCSGFQFSPDGKTLGFYFGPLAPCTCQDCSRGIMLLDTQTSKVLYRSDVGLGEWFAFTNNNHAILAIGPCEAGGIARYLPEKKRLEWIGSGRLGTPDIRWNPNRTALAISLQPFTGLGNEVWGINLALDWIFLPEHDPYNRLEDAATWTPDGTHLLLQRRSLHLDRGYYLFEAPRKIYRINVRTGEEVLLAGNRVEDFHLCSAHNPIPGTGECVNWLGDWVAIARIPFQPQRIAFDADFWQDPALTCLLRAENCPQEPAYLALNWRTGQNIRWASFKPPSPTPAPTQTQSPLPGPNLNRPPVYTDPQGGFGFYIGQDGTSLWLVPEQGKAILWVSEGSGFTYLP